MERSIPKRIKEKIMSVINDVLLAVCDLVKQQTTFPVYIGALPPDESITLAISSGGADSTFLTKGMAYSLDVVLNGKSANQKKISDALNDIHQFLTQSKTYPITEDFQITDIQTDSTPNYIGREENSKILYGSGLLIKFFYFKKQQ